jgi:hypothetical protein
MRRITPRMFFALVALAVAAIALTPKHHDEPSTSSQPAVASVKDDPRDDPAYRQRKAAFAGKCDQPPFGVAARKYEDLAALFGAENIHDLLRNTCRAKYMHDAKMRKTLHRIGFSDEFIDGNDVGYIALKVLQELKECMDAHHGDASRC